MSLCAVAAAGVTGGIGYRVTVEVHIGQGLPTFTILGRPDDICRESRDRIRAALLNSGFLWPAQRITMNLSPASHRKVGSALDVAMALALLIGTEQIPATCADGMAFVGELALDGRIRPVGGVAPMMMALQYPYISSPDSHGGAPVAVVVPVENASEAAMVAPVRVAETFGTWWSVWSAEHRGPTPVSMSPEITTPRPTRVPISLMCEVRPPDVSEWNWPRAVAITCYWSAHQDQGRPCWPSGCPDCFHHSMIRPLSR